MRVLPFLTGLLITAALIFSLNKTWGKIPALGKFLSPQQGFWQNAEPVRGSRNEEIKIPALEGEVEVYLDERLVPHVFAQNDRDLYFVQGYLHAKYRLWQMEFQTIAAAGRVSEYLGNNPAFLRFDREQRRMGMTYAAENCLKMMEADTENKPYFDAYTAGVNAYINSLTEGTLPIEYKLLGYTPEPWSNYKIALFLKLMSKDLAGYDRDLEFTNLKSAFSLAEMELLFPQIPDSSLPIIPAGTAFLPAGKTPIPPSTVDSLYYNKDTSIRAREVNKPDRNNGSNNWAVSGTKTASGYPILANDPHLGLSLPSIWYEMQLSSPTVNVYGATFPGSPNVIIGFNENISFGFTNSQRDVKDYYQIRFKDGSQNEYWYDSSWKTSTKRIETIKVKGGPDFLDTVAYTVFGPVMYDHNFVSEGDSTVALAVRWVAHEPSNEGAMWMKLDKAKSYNDYLEAIKTYACPGQNMLIATKTGDIALWQQGSFPARWKNQGLYVMPGEDASYAWQGFIPQEENPNILNPTSGYIQSANQFPVDSSYPYFIPGNYIAARGITIKNMLDTMQRITPLRMQQLQTNYYNSLAADALPFFIKKLDSSKLTDASLNALKEFSTWNYEMTPGSKTATLYQKWMDSLEGLIWEDEFGPIKGPKTLPDEQVLVEILIRDSAFRFIDNKNTESRETLKEVLALSLNGVTGSFPNGAPAWGDFKEVKIMHLLRDAVPSWGREVENVGGWGNTINAIKTTHGPSWRMIVHMSPEIEAYGIYPGGQSGNPGCPFYDSSVKDWAEGKYYRLWFMKKEEKDDKRIIGKLKFSKA